jgi:hypothetical protein
MSIDCETHDVAVLEAAKLKKRVEELERDIEYVLHTFEQSEGLGYRSRDRQFAIEILRRVVPKPD